MTALWITAGWVVLIVLICSIAHRVDRLGHQARQAHLEREFKAIELYANTKGGT